MRKICFQKSDVSEWPLAPLQCSLRGKSHRATYPLPGNYEATHFHFNNRKTDDKSFKLLKRLEQIRRRTKQVILFRCNQFQGLWRGYECERVKLSLRKSRSENKIALFFNYINSPICRGDEAIKSGWTFCLDPHIVSVMANNMASLFHWVIRKLNF